MHAPKISKKTKLVFFIIGTVVVCTSLVGLIVGAGDTTSRTAAEKVMKATPSPHPSASSSSLTEPVVPTSIPNFDKVKLTAEGWFPVPKTKDPRVLGAATAMALWSYDTGATTRATTLKHIADFSQPVPEYIGSPDRLQPLRGQLVSGVADHLMKDQSDFLGLQTEGIKVTAKVVAVKSDSQLSTWPKMDINVISLDLGGVHIVTTTLEVFFSAGATGQGQESDSQRIVVSAMVKCDKPDGYCGVASLNATPEL